MAGVWDLHALWQETLAALAATTIENSAAILGRHPSAESELTLARALGRLIRAFHKLEKSRILFGRCVSKSSEETAVPARHSISH
jgi:hypothetical protein